MSEPRAQRTLVKSPPELWAEVSDAGTLARHLGEFGDIRITRLEPETTVAWEGDPRTRHGGARGLGLGDQGDDHRLGDRGGGAHHRPFARRGGGAGGRRRGADRRRDGSRSRCRPPRRSRTPSLPDAEAEPERTESVAPPGFEEAPAVVAAPPRKRGFFARLFGRKERVELEPIVVEAPMAKAAMLAEPDVARRDRRPRRAARPSPSRSRGARRRGAPGRRRAARARRGDRRHGDAGRRGRGRPRRGPGRPRLRAPPPVQPRLIIVSNQETIAAPSDW